MSIKDIPTYRRDHAPEGPASEGEHSSVQRGAVVADTWSAIRQLARTREATDVRLPVADDTRSPRPTVLSFAVDLMALLAVVVATGVHTATATGFVLLGVTVLGIQTSRAGRLNPQLSQVIPEVGGGLAVAAVVTGVFVPASEAAGVLTLWPIASVALIAGRALLYAVIRAARRRDHGLAPTVIVGAGATAEAIARILEQRREYGLRPIGFVDSLDDPAGEDLPLPLLGRPAELVDIMARTNARSIVVAYGAARGSDMVGILRTAHELPYDVFALPRFFELGRAADGRPADDLWGFPLVRVRRPALTSLTWQMKRVFDVVVAGVLTILLAPVMAVIAAAVKLTSPGPVLFRQTRMSRKGRMFDMLKFRTMQDADDPDASWETPEDRVTRVGRILRPTRLDELPQLINVLRGEMSLVGPRPERPKYIERFADEVRGYSERHRVSAGLTGWAQVNGLMGDDASMEDRTRFDNGYIESWSLWQDVVILFRTLPALLRRAGS